MSEETQIDDAVPAETFRFAIVADGVVVNMTTATEAYADEQGWVLAPAPVDIGWLYDGEFTEASRPVPVPEFVTRAQAKIALDDAELFDQAAALIAQAPRKAQIWWAEADTFRRDNEWVALIGGLLGLDDEQIDDLFRAAALID